MIGKDVKDILYTVLFLIAGLVVLWWLGHAIGWGMQRKDAQRVICVKETHNPEFCQAEW